MLAERADRSGQAGYSRAFTGKNRWAHRMRIFGAVLVFLAITYFWDAEYNDGRFTDAARSMGQSILHSIAR
jgi:hypothetical protein